MWEPPVSTKSTTINFGPRVLEPENDKPDDIASRTTTSCFPCGDWRISLRYPVKVVEGDSSRPPQHGKLGNPPST